VALLALIVCARFGQKSFTKPLYEMLMATDSPTYPLVVRNKVPIIVRGVMLVFLGFTALMTWMVIRDNPEPRQWTPFIVLAFWVCGTWGFVHALNQEAIVIKIAGPGSIYIERGKAFQREERWTDRARLWIEDTKDNDGGPYFKLWMGAPGGPLVAKEGSSRGRLEGLQRILEAAVSGS
jgi:hypothetical protein